MLQERIFSHELASLYDKIVSYAVDTRLAKKGRDTMLWEYLPASDKQMGHNTFLIKNDLLALYKICYVSLIIDSSIVESSSCFFVGSSRYNNVLYIISVDLFDIELTNISLYNLVTKATKDFDTCFLSSRTIINIFLNIISRKYAIHLS